MKARILVAVVLAPLFFVDLFFLPPVCLAVTVSVIVAMASYELLRATKVVHHNHMYVYTALSAAAIAQANGNPKSMNVVLLGALIQSLGLQDLDWDTALRSCVKSKFVEVNLRCLDAGMRTAEGDRG